MREGILELIQRDVLRQVEQALRSMSARGILLKGMALMLRAREEGPRSRRAPPARPRRPTSSPAAGPSSGAPPSRLGFQGVPDARPTSTHHLAPVTRQGIAVEVHTRLVAPYWGLPESEMLARVRPLASLGSIDTLDPEGLLLHAIVHCSQHCFSHGLRAAWDVLAIVRDRPALDWDRLARWVSGMRAPRALV
jgi:hypothetical protein